MMENRGTSDDAFWVRGITEDLIIKIASSGNIRIPSIKEINSIDMNYAKYRNLLLSDIFFDAKQFPIAIVDTKKFSYQNEKKITLDVELIIKGKSEIVPLAIFVKRLGEELVQIESELNFSRTYFNIGKGKWSNTAILKDKATIKTNLFLFKE